MSLIHPELHQQGKKVLQALHDLESTSTIASEWESVCTGIQVISNRITPGHRDSKGRPEWYDILTSFGDGSLPRLLISDLGLSLAYYPGSVVGLCGTIFEHEVRAWGSGDRVCYAHFMRETVRQRLGVPAAGWAMQETYAQYLPEDIRQSKEFLI
jgi:hypothetical protein